MQSLREEMYRGWNSHRENMELGGSHPVSDYTWLTWLPWVIKDKKIIYMSVPKNACTSLKTMMCQLAGKSAPEKMGDVHRMNYLASLGGTVEESVIMLTSSDWFRFCFVRNPYDRLISAYKSKIAPGTKENNFQKFKMRINKMRGCGIDGITFRDFVLWVQAETNRDSHWEIQTKLLKTDLIDYQFIGKVERLDKDANTLYSILKVPVIPLQRLNVTSPVSLPKVYIQELADIVYEIYQSDFKQFGYDRDSWKG